MRVIGLTGGIAMGKSHAAAVFRRAHVPVFDADEAVHALQAQGGQAVAAIGEAFPGTVRDGAVDRARLRPLVLGHPAALLRLEAILHPLVRRARDAFLARHRRAGARFAVLDMPLLMETGQDRLVDCTVVVSAPRAVQMKRLLRRASMTDAQIAAVLARQLPDLERRRRADAVIRTGLSRYHAQLQLRALMRRFA